MDTLLVVFIAACVLSIMYCVWIVSAASAMNSQMINACAKFRDFGKVVWHMQTQKNEILKSLDFVLI